MILYPGENSWNTVRLDKRNYTAQKAKEQQKELIKRIPEQYIYIDDRCFRNAGRMKEVILSPQCKIIGKQAFESCQFRKGIDFPDTLIEIKKRAFAENHSLRQAIFPSSVKRIGAQCYRECNNLRVAKFEKNSNCTVIQEGVFDSCVKLNEVVLPEKTKGIERRAFYRCKELKKIIFFKKNATKI